MKKSLLSKLIILGEFKVGKTIFYKKLFNKKIPKEYIPTINIEQWEYHKV